MPDNWLNAQVPDHFVDMDKKAKGDFLIDMFGPWYASYYASWFTCAEEVPERVLVLDYDAFRTDPAATLERLLAHSGVPRSREQCAVALEAVWEGRTSFRFNRGISGRGAERFTADQIERLKRQLSYYPNLAGRVGRLVPGA